MKMFLQAVAACLLMVSSAHAVLYGDMIQILASDIEVVDGQVDLGNTTYVIDDDGNPTYAASDNWNVTDTVYPGSSAIGFLYCDASVSTWLGSDWQTAAVLNGAMDHVGTDVQNGYTDADSYQSNSMRCELHPNVEEDDLTEHEVEGTLYFTVTGDGNVSNARCRVDAVGSHYKATWNKADDEWTISYLIKRTGLSDLNGSETLSGFAQTWTKEYQEEIEDNDVVSVVVNIEVSNNTGTQPLWGDNNDSDYFITGKATHYVISDEE